VSDTEINNGPAVSPELAERRDDPANSGGDPELPGGMELAAGPDGVKPEYQRVFGSPAAYAESPTEYAVEDDAPEPAPKRARRSRKAAAPADDTSNPPEPAAEADAETAAGDGDEPATSDDDVGEAAPRQ
jgi:hypothetical protein